MHFRSIVRLVIRLAVCNYALLQTYKTFCRLETLSCLHDKPVFSLWHSSILLASVFHVWLTGAVSVPAAL